MYSPPSMAREEQRPPAAAAAAPVSSTTATPTPPTTTTPTTASTTARASHSHSHSLPDSPLPEDDSAGSHASSAASNNNMTAEGGGSSAAYQAPADDYDHHHHHHHHHHHRHPHPDPPPQPSSSSSPLRPRSRQHHHHPHHHHPHHTHNPQLPPPPRSSSFASPSSTNTSSNAASANTVRPPPPPMPQNETPSIRMVSGRPGPPEMQKHRSRHHSQGFFEPSLPTASLSDMAPPPLSASRIAAQTAMQQQQHHQHQHHHQQQHQQHQQQQQQQPSSSSTVPSHHPPAPAAPPPPPPTHAQYHNQHKRAQPPISHPSHNFEETPRSGRAGSGSSSPPAHLHTTAPASNNASGQQVHPNNNGFVGGHISAATTAANVVFPKQSAVQQPGASTEQPQQQHQNQGHHHHHHHHNHNHNLHLPLQPDRDHKPKGEKSKMKLFKPRHIGISRDKDAMIKDKGLPSPNKMGSGLSRIVSASTTSLADVPPPTNSSVYNLPNSSVNAIVPTDRQAAADKEKDKDKAHKHHFLSRQKMKLKGDDHYNLPLSSASSNSRPSDPNQPQSLYSFTPSSPVTTSTAFGKSVTGGLDLLHGLREKKKEEKALAESEQLEWLANTSGNLSSQNAFYGPSSLTSSGGYLAEAAMKETLQGFGLNNMSPEDAWDFLKAKLLVIFDGEDVRIAIEDLNKLVSVHIQCCVQRRAPIAIVEDLRELLVTGFSALDHSLNGISDEKLVPHLVRIWMLVFGTILPFIQVVFLPLDLEFKGCGTVMNVREANEFWSALQESTPPLDVRNIVLISFRDTVILSRYESLIATFSRLSIDSIQSSISTVNVTAKNSSSNGGRPGTAGSLDAGASSYSSQSSSLLNTAAGGSYSSEPPGDNRSRAASNTSSNPDQLIFQSFSSPAQRSTIIHRGGQKPDSSHLITETVGRMLQCVSVLASVQTGDEAQEKIELLSKALKHNWLGRARTGRDRRGFVGPKTGPSSTGAKGNGDSTSERFNPEKDGHGSNGNKVNVNANANANANARANGQANGDSGLGMRDGSREISVL